MIRSAITLPTPGSVSSSSALAELIFIRDDWLEVCDGELAYGWSAAVLGSVAHAELRNTIATTTPQRALRLGEANLAEGKFCFTYAS